MFWLLEAKWVGPIARIKHTKHSLIVVVRVKKQCAASSSLIHTCIAVLLLPTAHLLNNSSASFRKSQTQILWYCSRPVTSVRFIRFFTSIRPRVPPHVHKHGQIFQWGASKLKTNPLPNPHWAQPWGALRPFLRVPLPILRVWCMIFLTHYPMKVPICWTLSPAGSKMRNY